MPTLRSRSAAAVRAGWLQVALALCVALPAPAAADELWGHAKAYTAHLKVAADEAAALAAAAAVAVKTAEAALQAATRDLNALHATLANNPNLPRVTLDAARAQVGLAATAVGAAHATYAQLVTAAQVAAALVVAWTAGTLVGQGLVWVETICWDPVCDWTAVAPGAGPIYHWPDAGEVDDLLAALLRHAVVVDDPRLAAELPRSARDFVALGHPGLVALAYLRGQIALLQAYHRGAAAASALRFGEVLAAGDDITRHLQRVPAQQRAFGALLAEVATADGRAGLVEAVERADGALAEARAILVDAIGPQPSRADALLLAELDAEIAALRALPARVAEGFGPVPPPFGDVHAYIRPLTQAELDAFVADCGARGAACLPPGEVAFIQHSREVAGVTSAALPEVAPGLAAWDAEGLAPWEARHFADGRLDAVETMLGYSDPEGPLGTWRGVDLGQSPLIIEARPRVGFGDADGDGLIDVRDVQRRANVILGRVPPAEADDLNQDGAVDVRDLQASVAIILEQPVVGLPPPPRIPGQPPQCQMRCLDDGALTEGSSPDEATCRVAMEAACAQRGSVVDQLDYLDGDREAACECVGFSEQGVVLPLAPVLHLGECLDATVAACTTAGLRFASATCWP